MFNDMKKDYLAPALRAVNVRVELLFCNPSLGEKYSDQEVYDDGTGWN